MREPPKVLVMRQSGAGLHEGTLNGEHSSQEAVRFHASPQFPCSNPANMSCVPHGSVAEQGSLSDCVRQEYLRDRSVSCANSFSCQCIVNGFENQAPLVVATGRITIATRDADSAPPGQDSIQSFAAQRLLAVDLGHQALGAAPDTGMAVWPVSPVRHIVAPGWGTLRCPPSFTL